MYYSSQFYIFLWISFDYFIFFQRFPSFYFLPSLDSLALRIPALLCCRMYSITPSFGTFQTRYDESIGAFPMPTADTPHFSLWIKSHKPPLHWVNPGNHQTCVTTPLYDFLCFSYSIVLFINNAKRHLFYEIENQSKGFLRFTGPSGESRLYIACYRASWNQEASSSPEAGHLLFTNHFINRLNATPQTNRHFWNGHKLKRLHSNHPFLFFT